MSERHITPNMASRGISQRAVADVDDTHSEMGNEDRRPRRATVFDAVAGKSTAPKA